MLACATVEAQTVRLVPPGGLFDEESQVIECRTEQDLRRLFEWASTQKKRVALLGSARSFGEHFRPVASGIAADISLLGRGATPVEENPDGSIWVRAGAGTRFCDLRQLLPNYRVMCPPTSDRVTLAGALAACTHNTSGYFADDVRSFSLLTPSGEAFDCRPDAEGLARELFFAVPGAFGALGAVTELVLKMYPIDPEQKFGVHSVFAGPSMGGSYLRILEETRDDPRFKEGAGAVVYGNRGHAIVFGDELLPLGFPKNKRQALLTDDNIETHAFTQGLANRFPRLAESTVTRTYPRGTMRWAPWYGFQFFQRGFDRSFEVLGRRGLRYSAARALGVDRRLPVYHQAWFYPRSEQKAFVDLYFNVLDRYPGIEKRVEQQDLVLLPHCRWPAHSIGQTDAPVGVLTASYSTSSMSYEKKSRIAQFFREVSEQAYGISGGARVSLSKQIHCDAKLLRRMHKPWVDLIAPLKARVDPDGLLASRHLDVLLGGEAKR